MNLEDLVSKLKSIDEGIVTIGGPAPIAHAEQPNTVTMNVSMNGSGADGIKSLMAVLRDIEHGETGAMTTEPHHAHAQGGEEEPLIGDMVHSMEQEMAGQDSPLTTAPEEEMEEAVGEDDEHWENSADGSSGHHTHGIDAVTFSGDDMNSKAKVSPMARAPGTNPLRHPMHEEVASRLQSLYDTIKEERTEEKDEKGNVVRWKEEGEWKKAEKKDGRGKVTNMSDKARRETEKMSKKDMKEHAHHDDEEKKIRHLMRKYGWSHQEALEYFHYEKHDPKDYEDMEESQQMNESKELNDIIALTKYLKG